MSDVYDQVEQDYQEYLDSDYGQHSYEEAWIYGAIKSFEQIIKTYGVKFAIDKLSPPTVVTIEKYIAESDPF